MANSWPYNTERWQGLRLAVLRSEPLCRYCRELGRVTAATDVDHIVPVREDPDRAFDRSNLQPLCKTCHSSVKQREELTGYRIGCDVNGEPLAGWGESTSNTTRSGRVVFVVGPVCSGKSSLSERFASEHGWKHVAIDACRLTARSEAEAWRRLVSAIRDKSLVESLGTNERLADAAIGAARRYSIRVVGVNAPVPLLLERYEKRGMRGRTVGDPRDSIRRVGARLERLSVLRIDTIVRTDCDFGEAYQRFERAVLAA